MTYYIVQVAIKNDLYTVNPVVFANVFVLSSSVKFVDLTVYW